MSLPFELCWLKKIKAYIPMLCNLFYLTPFISRPEHPKQGRRYRSNIALKKRFLAMPY